MLAYRGSDPIGMLLVIPDLTSGAVATAPRSIQEAEKLNVLGIGVRSAQRGNPLSMPASSATLKSTPLPMRGDRRNSARRCRTAHGLRERE